MSARDIQEESKAGKSYIRGGTVYDADAVGEESESDAEDPDSLQEKKKQLKFLFKCGDDLRQDNLTLQFFKIMDNLWHKNSMNMEMICY